MTLHGRKRIQCSIVPPFCAQILNIIALWVLSMIVRSPDMVHELQGTRSDVLSEQEIHPALPTPLSKVEPSYRDHDLNYRKCDAFDFTAVSDK